MTALTLYGSSVASTTLSTAAQLSSATGGTETSVTTTGPASGSGYVEIRGSTGSSAVNASIPSPSGNGFLWDVTTLEGQTITAGSWTAAVGILDTKGSGPFSSLTLRFYKRSSAGVYTLIGSIAMGSGTISTTRTTFSLSGSALGSMAFGTGDKLYADLWLQANGWGSDPIKNFVTTSATQGLANDLQITTPGYTPSSTTAIKDLATRLRLISATQGKDLLTRLQLGRVQDLASRLRLGRVRDLSTRLRLGRIQDLATRLRLISATQGKDLATRVRLVSPVGLTKDIATRFVLGLNHVTVTIAGVEVAFDEDSWQLHLTADERQRAQMTVLDYTGTTFYTTKEQIIITDPVLGRLFAGVIIDDKQDKSNVYPDPTVEHQIDTVDNFYFVGKRTSNRQYTTPTYTSKIVFDAVSDVLASEGIVAPAAQRTDTTQSDWSAGTLTNTIATMNVGDGDLELTSSSSVTKSYQVASDWSSGGTLTNVQANSGGDVSLVGYTRNWDDGVFSGQTLYGTRTPGQGVTNGQFTLTTGNNTDARSRLSFAGSSWQNFILEVDITIPPAGGQIGVVYRTTGWQNNNNTFAYTCIATTTGISLGTGTNSSSGSGLFGNLVTASVSLTAGTTYRFKSEISGSTHQIYLNGTRYITITDSSYTAAGYLGLRTFYFVSGATNTLTVDFDNFGVMAALSGTWQSSSTSINAITSIATSIITWDTSLSTGGTVLVQTSIDGGSTWQTATSGGPIPGLTAGTSGTGKSVLVKVSLSNTTATTMPDIRNLSWTVTGGYLSSGTRVSPSLSLTPAGRIGSSLVAWNASFPSAATTLGVDVSLDGGSTWTDVSAQNGGPIPGLNGQPDPTVDGFNADTSANYTSTSGSGGGQATWTYDLAHSRLVAAGGASSVFLYSSIAIANIDLFCDMDESDAGGLVCCFSDQADYYGLVVADSQSAATTPNMMTLYRTSGGVQTSVATGSISFLRGTYHRIRLTNLDGTITATFDGTPILTYVDGSPLVAGLAGLYQTGGIPTNYAARAFGPPVDLGPTGLTTSVARWYQLWIQPMGDLAAGKSVMTRCRLATTDATVTPQVLDLTVGVYSNAIGIGALLPGADYRQHLISDVLSDVVRQSNYLCYIDPYKGLNVRSYQATPAPWIVQSSTLGLAAVDLEADNNLAVEVSNDLYRNRQWLTGVNLTIVTSNAFAGDGQRTSFTLSFSVAPGTVPTVTLNNQAQQVGPKGTTGAQWYYAPGDATIAQDSGQTVLVSTDVLSVSYTGTYVGPVMAEDTAQQTMLAPVEGGSGIVEAVEDVSQRNMTEDAAIAYATQLITRYAVAGRTLTFATTRNGLAIGQILTVFLPEEGLFDVSMTILSIDITMRTQPGNTIQYLYVVTASELPNPGSWQKLLASSLLD